MPRPPRRAAASRPGGSPAPRELADRLHSAAIHLLRRLRAQDAASGLSAPRLSVLSVLAFGGPRSLTGLAAAEQVRAPTMSRLIRDLERKGLVARATDPEDRRVQWISATAAGRRLLQKGRARRVARLEQDLKALAPGEYRALMQAITVLERISRPDPPSR